jgi:hypothetical protein
MNHKKLRPAASGNPTAANSPMDDHLARASQPLSAACITNVRI